MADQVANNSVQESLSALVDNQASEMELHRLLKQAQGDENVRSTWGRYQLASAAMRSDLPAGDYTDLSARIMAAIDDEPVHQADGAVNTAAGQERSSQSTPVRWWQSAGRFAIAASVAGAVVLGVQHANVAGPEAEFAEAGPAVSSQAVPLPAGFNAPSLSARTVSSHDRYEPRLKESRQVIFVPRDGGKSPSNKALQQHLNQLMMEHAGHAALNSGRGMMPFARVARMDEE